MTFKARCIGLVRFSVLTPTYYSERFATLDDTAAHLFSDDRMDLRFHLFENLCLPSLVRQTDPDFDCVVLTAETLPDRHMDRLRALLDPHENLHLRPVGTERHYQLIKAGYNSVPALGCSHRILFRLDDDDAVDLDFVRRTRRLAEGLAAIQGPETPFIIAFNRGFYVRGTLDGRNEVFDTVERAPLSAGLTLVAPMDHPTNPYRYNHRKLAQHYNTFTDISVPGFIRSVHGDNKSNPAQMGLTHKLKPAKADRLLQRHFGFSLAELEGL